MLMEKYPVVILPGWLLGGKRFEPLRLGFEKKGYKTFVVDFPGFEDSPPLKEVFDLTDYVKDLHHFLKTKKIHKAIFVAHSFGGRVALKLLSQHPDRAVALILSGTPGYPELSPWRRYLTIGIAKTGNFLASIPPFMFTRPLLRKLFYRVTKTTDYARVSGVMRETFKKIIKEQLVDYMHKIRIPTLLLWGGNDRLVPVTIARKMQMTIKNARLVIIPEKGHMFAYREPEVIVGEVTEFLKQLSE